MASEIQAFQVTTPPGTLAAAPLVTNLSMPARIVRRIEWKVPPGPNGNLGFAFGAAGQPVLPYNAGAFIVTSDEADAWDLTDQIESGSWQLFSYNTGLLPHTVYLRFLLDQPGAVAAGSTPGLIDASQITPLTADDLAALQAAATVLPDLGTVTDPGDGKTRPGPLVGTLVPFKGAPAFPTGLPVPAVGP